uniref:G-patch domain-containing protein n=1 Tax=Acrobeloides nanus TaxID=290746 RepID=A0A914C4V9_9BILA
MHASRIDITDVDVANVDVTNDDVTDVYIKDADITDGSPYEPEKALVYPVVGEAIEHQIGIIKETEARKEKDKSNVIWKGKPSNRLLRLENQPSPEELRLRAGVPIRLVYPCSSGLRHRYLLEVLLFKEKLAQDPENIEIHEKLKESQKKLHSNDQIRNWESQNFGSFFYCQRVKILTEDELEPDDTRFYSWSTRVNLQKFQPCYGGPGLALMLKTGWKVGKGLGKKEDGQVEPYIVTLKFSNKGLATIEDRPKGLTSQAKNSISILHEYCTKKRMVAPSFDFKTVLDAKNKFIGVMSKALFCGIIFSIPEVMKNSREGKKALCLKILKTALKFTDEEIGKLLCENGKTLKKLKAKNQENGADDKKSNEGNTDVILKDKEYAIPFATDMKDGKRKLAHKLLIKELRFDETDLGNPKVNWLNQSKNNVKEKELNQVVPNDENLPIASSSNQNLKDNEVVPESSGLNNKEPNEEMNKKQAVFPSDEEEFFGKEFLEILNKENLETIERQSVFPDDSEEFFDKEFLELLSESNFKMFPEKTQENKMVEHQILEETKNLEATVNCQNSIQNDTCFEDNEVDVEEEEPSNTFNLSSIKKLISNKGGQIYYDKLKEIYFERIGEVLTISKINQLLGTKEKTPMMAFKKCEAKIFTTSMNISSKLIIHYTEEDK